MARVLVATRTEIGPADEAAYLAVINRWQAALQAAGRRCWVFRRRGEPGTFLEFVEGDGPADPRLGVAPDLAARLGALGRRTGGDELWDETT